MAGTQDASLPKARRGPARLGLGEEPVALMDPLRYARNPDVQLHSEDEQCAVLLDPRTGQVRGLNATGLFIWRLCDGSRDLQAVVEALCQTFEDVPEDLVSEQVLSFLAALAAAGFVTLVEG